MADDEVCSIAFVIILVRSFIREIHCNAKFPTDQFATRMLQLAVLHHRLSHEVRQYKGPCSQECLPPRERILFMACEACIGLCGRLHVCQVEKLLQEFGSHTPADILQEAYLHVDAHSHEPLSDQYRAPTVKTSVVDSLVVFCPELHAIAVSSDGPTRFEPELPAVPREMDTEAHVASTLSGGDFMAFAPPIAYEFIGPCDAKGCPESVEAVSELPSLDSRVQDQGEGDWASNCSLTPLSFFSREGPSILFFRSLAETPDTVSWASSPCTDEMPSQTPVYTSSPLDWDPKSKPDTGELFSRRPRSHSPVAHPRNYFIPLRKRSKSKSEAQACPHGACDIAPFAHSTLQSSPGRTPRTICSISTATVSSRCSSVSDFEWEWAVEEVREKGDDDEIANLLARLHLLTGPVTPNISGVS